MSTTGLDIFDRTLHETNTWLKEVMGELGTENRRHAFQALRAVMHTLRDRLTADEAANLSAQLPLLVRGVFFEGWHPAGVPTRERSREAFLGKVARHLEETRTGDVDAEAAVRAVLGALEHHVTAGEVAHVKHTLPKHIRELWP